MNHTQLPRKSSLGVLFSGVMIGAAATLLGLRAAGVPLQPGVNGPAFQKFYAVYEALSRQYYRAIPQKTLVEGAIAGMTQSVKDPYTDYFTPSVATQFHNMLSGSYSGIGVIIEQRGGELVVNSVMPSSPAQKAGLKPGDVIVRVNGTPISGMDLSKASNLILGPSGTRIRLTIKRPTVPDRLLTITATREKVTAPTVFTRMLPHQIGLIQVTIVGSNTGKEFLSGLQQLQHQGAKRFILDLRGNPGGYLDQAIVIANRLIPSGKVIVQTRDRNGHIDKTTSQGPGLKQPIVVLMNESTASAAEVLAAALHDDVRAPLVGTKSFGKGTVQETEMFPDGSGLKYTVAEWLTPDGQWIHHRGLQPTVHVGLPWYTNLPPVSDVKTPLKINQNTADVKTVQETLRALGYTVDRVDGYFDASTRDAVLLFQKKTGLPTTGVVDRNTADLLQTAIDKLAAASDTQLKRAEQVAMHLQ